MKQIKEQVNKVSRRRFLKSIAGAGLGVAGSPFLIRALAQEMVKGTTVAERAVNAAKALDVDVDLTILIWGGFSEALRAVVPEFKKKTGIGIGNYIELGYTEIPARMMSEAVARAGKIDIFHHDYYIVGQAAAAGLLQPLDEWISTGGLDLPKGWVGISGRLGRFRGHTYAINSDTDALMFTARKDWVENPEEQAAFEDRYGYPLDAANGPKTWDEYRDWAEFFTRDLDGDGEIDLWGTVSYRTRLIGFKWWMTHLLSKGKLPFDEDMHPQIDSPEGVKATREYVALKPFMPPEIEAWGTPQIYPFGAKGNIFSAYIWPSFALYSNNPEMSTTVGKWNYYPLPGSMVQGQLLRRSIHGLSSVFSVNSYSKHSEAAYWLLQWLNDPEISGGWVADVRSYYDPFRKAHFTDPRVVQGYTPELMKVHKKNVEIAAPVITLVGSAEYHDVLDLNLRKAFAERISPEEAMTQTAEEWEKITNKIGRRAQKNDWQMARELYPKR